MNNSSLPNNIKSAHQYLPNTGNEENVVLGPTSPSPGPTLPKELAAAPIAVVKSSPTTLNTPAQ